LLIYFPGCNFEKKNSSCVVSALSSDWAKPPSENGTLRISAWPPSKRQTTTTSN